VEFERVLGRPAELPGEELRSHLAADLSERIRVKPGVGRAPRGDVDCGVATLQFLPELRRAVCADGEGTAEPAGLLCIAFAEACVQGGLPDLVGERVVAVAEKRLHPRLGDRVAGSDAVQPMHP